MNLENRGKIMCQLCKQVFNQPAVSGPKKSLNCCKLRHLGNTY